MTAPLHIGQVPQLFFDNYIIEMVQGLTRRMHRPQKCAQNPLIAGDRPWEITPYFRTGTMNVSFDPLERLYKCWYCDYAWDYDEYMARGEDHAGLVVGGWLDTADCPLALRRVRGRDKLAQAGAGLPPGRRPPNQYLPGTRRLRSGVHQLFLPGRAGNRSRAPLQGPPLAAPIRQHRSGQGPDQRGLLGRRPELDHARAHRGGGQQHRAHLRG